MSLCPGVAAPTRALNGVTIQPTKFVTYKLDIYY